MYCCWSEVSAEAASPEEALVSDRRRVLSSLKQGQRRGGWGLVETGEMGLEGEVHFWKPHFAF